MTFWKDKRYRRERGGASPLPLRGTPRGDMLWHGWEREYWMRVLPTMSPAQQSYTRGLHEAAGYPLEGPL